MNSFSWESLLSSGARYILISTFFFALMNVCVKGLDRIPTHEVVFFRAAVALGLCWVMIKRRKLHPWGTHKKILIARGVAGTAALTLYFYTLKVMPLASAATVQYLSPIFTMILATFIVKEATSFKQYLFFLIAFSGVVLIKGFDPRVTAVEISIGVLAAFGSGVAYNMIRLLAGKEDPLVIVFYFPLITVPTIGSYTVLHWTWPRPLEWALLLSVGVFVQIAQIFMTKGYQAEPASKVAFINYLGVVFALGFGYFIFDETIRPEAFAGILLIIIGVFLANRARIAEAR